MQDKTHVLRYLDSFLETVEEGAKRLDAVVQLERGFVVAEVLCELTSKLLEVGHVTL